MQGRVPEKRLAAVRIKRTPPIYFTSPQTAESDKLLDGKRAGPPEDVGGPGGYEAFLDTILNHPDSDEGIEYLEWVGGEFEPEAFDRRTTNNTLVRLASNGWGKK